MTAARRQIQARNAASLSSLPVICGTRVVADLPQFWAARIRSLLLAITTAPDGPGRRASRAGPG